MAESENVYNTFQIYLTGESVNQKIVRHPSTNTARITSAEVDITINLEKELFEFGEPGSQQTTKPKEKSGNKIRSRTTNPSEQFGGANVCTGPYVLNPTKVETHCPGFFSFVSAARLLEAIADPPGPAATKCHDLVCQRSCRLQPLTRTNRDLCGEGF